MYESCGARYNRISHRKTQRTRVPTCKPAFVSAKPVIAYKPSYRKTNTNSNKSHETQDYKLYLTLSSLGMTGDENVMHEGAPHGSAKLVRFYLVFFLNFCLRYNFFC